MGPPVFLSIKGSIRKRFNENCEFLPRASARHDEFRIEKLQEHSFSKQTNIWQEIQTNLFEARRKGICMKREYFE